MKRVLVLAVVVAGLAIALPFAASATTYQPLDQATAEADLNGGYGTGADQTAPSSDSFTAAEVAPAMIASEDGVSLSTVYGTCVVGPGQFCPSVTTSTTSDVHCWAVDDDSRMASWWGIRPYQQNVAEHRHWCAHLGNGITYVSSHNHSQSHWLCDINNTSDEFYSRGKGKTWVTRTTGANFNCPIIGFIPFNVDRWQRWVTNSWGTVSLIARSGNITF